MATPIYVDGSHGADGNNGESWALAKATVGAAVTTCDAGGTVYIAPGYYAEAVTVSKNLTLEAVQKWTADIYGKLYITAGDVYCTNLKVRVAVGPAIQSATTGTATLRNCWMECMSASTNGALYGTNIDAQGCVILSYPNGVTRDCVYLVDQVSFVGNTLRGKANCRGVHLVASVTEDIVVTDNIFCVGVWALQVRMSGTPQSINLDYNRYYYTINATRTLLGYTSLAAAQAAGYEVNGSEGAVTWGNDYYLPEDSALLTAGHSGGRVGAQTGAYVCSSSVNAWSGWTGTNCTYIDNQWTLDDAQASGTVLSPVIDLGAAYDVNGLSFSALQTFPTNIVDTTNTGGNPEYLTAEIRGQAASFLAGDGTPAWQEVNLQDQADPVLGAWRYVQVRLTLRSDGS